MKLGINRDVNRKIFDLVSSWHPLILSMLILIAFMTVTPFALFIQKLIYSLYSTENIYLYYIAYYASSWFYYFLFINVRFGGFILLVLFLIVKKSRIADVILASPITYPEIGISSIWLRILTYLAVIVSFGFVARTFRTLTGLTDLPFAFTDDIFDFLIKIFFAPVSEEIYYRFLILYIIAVLFGRIPAIFISSFLFTISHDLSSPIEVLWAFSMGLAAALLTVTYGTLWPAIGTHIINNMVFYSGHP